jgi:two-component system phosphate regulon sensor histidine kinase PhoR
MSSFSIRSSTIRLGIFISTLVIAGIVVFQLIWLRQEYQREQKEFDSSVVKAIKGLYEDIKSNNYNISRLSELIESPEAHLYLAKINFPVNFDTIAAYMQYDLEDFGVFTDCILGIYSKDSGTYVYTELLKAAITRSKTKVSLPLVTRNYDHLALYFPNRRQYILGKMNFWIISSALLLIVLILFGAGLYYFYRQKFLAETQKDFIHNFTHEFKTPVSVISLAADVLKNPSITEKPEKLATYAGIVEYQAAYLKNQTEKLLNFAYTESRHLHFSKERVNMHELIRAAVSNLAPLIDEKKASINLALEATDPYLQANKDYLTIVVINLLDNAIKYSKDPKVIISTSNIDGKIVLAIKDNGIGIDKRQQKKMFKKFYRIRKDETYLSKGFGIGLTFVKNIVTAHHGKIKVESQPGKGSTFIVELPS